MRTRLVVLGIVTTLALLATAACSSEPTAELTAAQAAVDQAAAGLGQDVIEFWEAAKAAAHQEAQRLADQP